MTTPAQRAIAKLILGSAPQSPLKGPAPLTITRGTIAAVNVPSVVGPITVVRLPGSSVAVPAEVAVGYGAQVGDVVDILVAPPRLIVLGTTSNLPAGGGIASYKSLTGPGESEAPGALTQDGPLAVTNGLFTVAALAEDPATDPGSFYYNTTYDIMRYCDGTGWHTVGTGSSTFNISQTFTVAGYVQTNMNIPAMYLPPIASGQSISLIGATFCAATSMTITVRHLAAPFGYGNEPYFWGSGANVTGLTSVTVGTSSSGFTSITPVACSNGDAFGIVPNSDGSVLSVSLVFEVTS